MTPIGYPGGWERSIEVLPTAPYTALGTSAVAKPWKEKLRKFEANQRRTNPSAYSKQDQYSFELLVRDSQQVDGGIYSCVARNDYGEHKGDVTLDVLGEANNHPKKPRRNTGRSFSVGGIHEQFAEEERGTADHLARRYTSINHDDRKMRDVPRFEWAPGGDEPFHSYNGEKIMFCQMVGAIVACSVKKGGVWRLIVEVGMPESKQHIFTGYGQRYLKARANWVQGLGHNGDLVSFSTQP
ncbi:down syndrome cell adhesion molecule [Trichonephila clavipes]|nr:down syndrome cell adhesion molecule [Trichonephila clavipes]